MFIVNLPPKKVWVRKEYLRDLRDGHGEYVLGYWVSLKSLWGRSFYFETYMPEYGAMFDKLPIAAFLEWESNYPDCPRSPQDRDDYDLPLSDLQYWDSFDFDTEIVPKQFLYSMSVRVKHRSGKVTEGGKYVFTIDSCHRDLNRTDLSYSEVPDEHKSHNCVILSNGQFGLYPNNRCQWFDESLTPSDVKFPDFLVSTRPFNVETGGQGKRLGDAEEYFWDYEEDGKKPLAAKPRSAAANRYFPRDDEWTGQETPDEKEALDAVKNQVNYPPSAFSGDYRGPLYAPYKKMAPIPGLEDYNGENE